MTTDEQTKEQTANTTAPAAAIPASDKPSEAAPKESPKAKKPAAIKEAKPTKEAKDGKEPKAAPKPLKPSPKKVAPKEAKEPKAAKAAKKAKPSAKAKKAEPKSPKSPKAETPIKRPTNGKYARHPKNPFREGSSYALAFDVLASNKKGMNRADLTREYSRVSKKPLKNAAYDIAVLLSPKSEKPTSERHKSCREGFGIRKENAFVQIILPGKE